MRLQGINLPADKTWGSCSGEELISCIILASPDTCDECLGHWEDGYHPSEVHLRQGHGTRWYACHCIKPTLSFLILSLKFSPGPAFSLLLLNPIVIYVVLWTTSNPLRNKVILYLGRATNPFRMDEWLVSYNVICSVLWVFYILFKWILIFYCCENIRGWGRKGDWWVVTRWKSNQGIS